MTFLPIVDRELRVRARWRSTYVVRAAVAVLAIAVTIVMLFFAAVAGPGKVGKIMLHVLGWIAFGFCVIDGFRSTADCLSEEKREGTLGLLFLTDLRGFDVVLGKFAAASLSSFYGVLAIIPALAIPVLLGGVTGTEFWRVVLALLNTLFFSLTAGMFVSAISREERKAWTGTVILVGIPVVLFAVLHATSVTPLFGFLSPTTAMLTAFEPGYSASAKLYWQSLAITNVTSWLWLLAASLVLPRAWQESRTDQRRAATSNLTPRQQHRRAELLSANPVWWLTARRDNTRRSLWIIVSIAAAIALGVWGWGQGDATIGWCLFGGAVALHFIINVWVASEACYSFADARSSGAMELLLSTPLTVRQIVRGQQLAIKDLFFRPVLALVVVETLLMIAQIVAVSAKRNGTWEAVSVFVLVGFSIGWFVLDVFAVSRVGMWFGITSPKPTQALTKTVLYVLVLPLLVAPCCSIVSGGLMLAKSVIFLTWAQSKLDNEFRAAATQRFEGQRSSDWLKSPAPPKLTLPPV
jgi:hypothetical protein